MQNLKNHFYSYKIYWCLLLGLFILFLILSLFLPLLSYQEAKRAVIVQETFLRKSLLPTFNGVPYFTKPPLQVYISLPFYFFGYFFQLEIFALRLISILSYAILAYLVYLIQKKELSKSLLTLLILFASYRFLSFIYRIDLEPSFILFNMLSFYYLLKYLENPTSQKIFLFYFFFACAFLIRGPLHFFLIPAYFFYGLYTKDKKIFKLLLHPLGLLFCSLLISPWFLYGYYKFGIEVFQEFLNKDVGDRLFEKKDPFFYYFKAYLLNFLLFFILILLKIKEFKMYWKEKATDSFKLSFFSTFIPLVLLSFTGEKFDKYILFLFPVSALWITEYILAFYSLRWLLKVGALLTGVNLIIIIITLILNAKDIRKKSELFTALLLNNQVSNITFYEKVHPLILFYTKKTYPIITEKRKAVEALNKGRMILSQKPIEDLLYAAVYSDPFKRGEFWYLYKKR